MTDHWMHMREVDDTEQRVPWTPGPWGVEATPQMLWVGPMRPNGEKCDDVVVSLAYADLTHASKVRQQSNARLIAAAPDLVEALQAMLRVFAPYPREDTEGWREEHEACLAARAAIAEAGAA